MPRVKIDYIVSFSSEDPEHPANNLLNREVSKKKWLCKKGDSSCSVVLQLTKAVKISAVHIGAYHAALVEVLVARSETSSDHFQVLVPRAVLLSREEARRDVPVERVRSFSAEQLSAGVRHQRWDRVRVVCDQPYNKHSKFGLSFVHIDECEESTRASLTSADNTAATVPSTSSVSTAVPSRLLALDTFSSDEDEFKPGELFKKHLQKNNVSDGHINATSSTGAQIRQATSQALKNISESSTKLMKTPISKPSVMRDRITTDETKSDRSRNTLLYTEDDDKPHAKIDTVVQRHKDEREKEDKHKHVIKNDKKEKSKLNNSIHKQKDERKETPKRNSYSPNKDGTQNRNKIHQKPDDDKSVRDHKKDKDDRKRRRSNSQENAVLAEPTTEPHTLLKGVVLVLSGYENPRRANIRNLALALGARVERDWGPSCTHLICAFPNTPKLRAARARGGGPPAARAEWLEACARHRRRLPWAWYATEPSRLVEPGPELLRLEQADARQPPQPPQPDSDDTDDEIERVLQEQKKRRVSASKEATRPLGAGDSTDEEASATPTTKQFGGRLPDFFDGYTFAVDAELHDAELMKRYIRAYGGLVLEMSEVEDGSEVDYVVGGRSAGPAPPAGRPVTPAWLARCHAAKALLPDT